MDDARPPVFVIVFPLHQPFCFQPVNGDADRSAGQANLGAEHIHRERALVQQRFQNTEVREPQPSRANILMRMGFEGVEGLPENQPEMDAAEPKWRFCLRFQGLNPFKYLYINILDAKVIGN